MGKTDAERLKRWRQRELAKGRKSISFMLSCEATSKLKSIQLRTGETISGVIERLLLGRGPTVKR